MLDDEESVAKGLTTASAAEILEGDDVIEAMAADLLALRAGVLEATVAADVDQDLCCEAMDVLSHECLPDVGAGLPWWRSRTSGVVDSRGLAWLSAARRHLLRTNRWRRRLRPRIWRVAQGATSTVGRTLGDRELVEALAVDGRAWQLWRVR